MCAQRRLKFLLRESKSPQPICPCILSGEKWSERAQVCRGGCLRHKGRIREGSLMNRATGRAARRIFVSLLLSVLTLAALPMIAFAQDASAAKSLEGKWGGALGSGEAKLHVIVTISKNSSGEYSGSLNSVDQGVTIPMNNITLQGDSVRFELKSVGGVYQGTLSKDGGEITGSWTQTAAQNPHPLSLTRQAAGTVSQTPAVAT